MKLSWMEKREKLKNLITELSRLYGGDDVEFLKEYIDEVLKEWSHDLNRAIECFEGLL